MKKKSYCLFIDSGLGGLHILAKSRKFCPKANFLYIADDKNIPYGNKSPQEIENYILSILNRFQNCYNIVCLVLACNTATASAINSLRKKTTIPIIGTEPNIKSPSSLNYKKIAILVTPSTEKTIRYQKLTNDSCFTISCNNLATLIENSLQQNKDINLDQILSKIKDKNADAIVLGCTHYNFIVEKLKVLKLPIFDSIDGVSKQIRLVLNNSPIGTGNTIILTSSRNQKTQNAYIKYYKYLLSK